MSRYKAKILYYFNIIGYLMTVFVIILAMITLEWGLLVLGVAILLCNLIGWGDVRELKKNPQWVNKKEIIIASNIDILDASGKEV